MSNEYNERVKQRAIELAAVENGESHATNGHFHYVRFLPLARLSVQREAETYKAAWLKRTQYAGLSTMQDWLDEELAENGLIPPQTQTT